jgi:hypothetical protein
MVKFYHGIFLKRFSKQNAFNVTFFVFTKSIASSLKKFQHLAISYKICKYSTNYFSFC